MLTTRIYDRRNMFWISIIWCCSQLKELSGILNVADACIVSITLGTHHFHHLDPAFPQASLSGLTVLFLSYALLWPPMHWCYNRPKAWSHSSLWLHVEPYNGYRERMKLAIRRTTLQSWVWCGWEWFIDPWELWPNYARPTDVKKNQHTCHLWTRSSRSRESIVCQLQKNSGNISGGIMSN